MANIYDLNLICGIRDTSMVDLREIDFVLKPDIVTNSNFLTAYKLDSLNIIADQSINDLKYKPQLDLFADAGLFAAYLPYPGRIGFSTGFSLSWNIFDGHQRTIQREKSDINLKTIEFEKKNFMTQNDINKNKILNQIEAVNQRLHLYEQQADQYDKLYKAYSRELTLGEASVMDFKNLLKDMTAKKQETLLLKMERQLLINSYNYLTY
jgi:outer membrane protein TolC